MPTILEEDSPHYEEFPTETEEVLSTGQEHSVGIVDRVLTGIEDKVTAVLENPRVQGVDKIARGKDAMLYNPVQGLTMQFGGAEQIITGKEVPTPQTPLGSTWEGAKNIVKGGLKTLIPTARKNTEGNVQVADGVRDILVGDVPPEAPEPSSGNPTDMPDGTWKSVPGM